MGYNGYETPVTFADDVPYPFRISFNLTTTIGVIVSLIVGCLVSHFTEPEKLLDENLIIPQIRTKKPILPGYDVVPSKELKQITTVPKSGVT